jgi:DNA-binding response OmpR family regulator
LAKTANMALLILDRVVPDLILLDISMPGMSGFDLLEVIQGKPGLANIPVVFLTAHGTREFVYRAASYGSRHYLVKPIDPGLLKSKVREALGQG